MTQLRCHLTDRASRECRRIWFDATIRAVPNHGHRWTKTLAMKGATGWNVGTAQVQNGGHEINIRRQIHNNAFHT